MSRRPEDALQALLAKERDLLLTADFEGLGALAGRKQVLLDQLDGRGFATSPPAALREAAMRNARLLEAARAGVQRAHATLRSSAADVTTYRADGSRQAIAAPKSALETKA